MPGGQYTNLKEQARSLGLEARWPEVAKTYAQVNEMFGNIVKVTPSSKVVGDMTLAMMTAGLSRADVENPKRETAFPDSVIAFFKGELGQPPNRARAYRLRTLIRSEPFWSRHWGGRSAMKTCYPTCYTQMCF